MQQIKETYPHYSLEIGQLQASSAPALLTCYGLGSCVGVFLFDRINKIGGGAHIALPFYNEYDLVSSKLHFADCAIETLLYQMQAMGAAVSMLRAKLVGGAHLSGFSSINIGQQNITAVRTIINKKGIFLAGTEVGGNVGRRAAFNTYTGMVEVRSEQNKIIL